MVQAEDPELRLGWTSGPNFRGTLDILWSCSITMFLCSWSVLCLNVPGPNETKRQVLWRKLCLTALGVLCPELPLTFAFGQWLQARQSLRDISSLYSGSRPASERTASERQLKSRWLAGFLTRKKWRRADGPLENWTITEAFFAEMGGFRLKTRDCLPFPVDAKQIHYLVSRGFMELPTLGHRDIEDKNKADGLLRTITLCQILWFLVNCSGRWAQRLTVTTLETTTVSFILCSSMTAFFWWRKPADVFLPEVIETEVRILEVLRKEDVRPHEWDRTPLDFVNRREWWWSKCWSNFVNILNHMGLKFGSEVTPIDRIPDTQQKAFSRKQQWVIALLAYAYLSVFFVAWHHSFLTSVEQTLWRAACIIMMGCVTVLLIALEVEIAWPKLKQKLRASSLSQHLTSASVGRIFQSEYLEWPRKVFRKLDRRLDRIRNNSAKKDPTLTMSLKLILPMYLIGFLYCNARTYFFVADFMELRSLPANAYETVEWQEFWPNVS